MRLGALTLPNVGWDGRDAGFDELIVYYPPDFAMPPGSVAPGVFERAIRDVLPSLR